MSKPIPFCTRCQANEGRRCELCSDPRIVYARLDRDPVEVEVDAMFWEQNEADITAADMREGLVHRISEKNKHE